MSGIKLVTNEAEFDGWKSVSVSRSLAELSGSFEFTLAEIPDLLADAPRISTQDQVEIFVGDKLLMTGFVDTVVANFSGQNREFVVRGRDRTADLVDSGYVGEEYLANVDLRSFIRRLIEPFGLGLKIDEGVDIGPRFPQLAIERGSTAWDAIEKYSRNRGILITTSPEGDLILTKPGARRSRVQLIEGENIKEGSATRDFTNRFRDYQVDSHAPQLQEIFGQVLQAFSKDPEVKRNRRLVLIAETNATPDQVRARAQWEAINRASQSVALSLVVPGWRQDEAGDEFWEVNTLVDVYLPTVGLDETLLIDEVQFSLDEGGGQLTSLSLTRRDAYQPQPEVPVEFEGVLLGEAD